VHITYSSAMFNIAEYAYKDFFFHMYEKYIRNNTSVKKKREPSK
jgi:hypothetical protein